MPHEIPAGRLTQPRVAANALAAAFTATMLWFTAQGFMWLDDYELQSLAYQAPSWDPEFLLQPWGGHFMPAGFALAQVLAKTMPFSYGPMVILITAGMGVFAFASARLFIFLLGNRWRALLPIGLVLVSGAVWDAATWWVAALNAVPLLAAIPLATRWHLVWLRDGSPRAAFLAWLTVVVACMFFEKALGLIGFLALVTIALRGRWDPQRNRVHTTLLLCAYGVTILALGIAYLASSTGTVAEVPDPSTLAAFVVEGGLAFPPLVLGGPWVWAAPAVAATPLILEVATLILLLGFAVGQSVRSPRAAVMWVGLTGYVLAVIVIVATGRAGWGLQVITQPRYFAEAVVYFVVAATIAQAYLGTDSRVTGEASRNRKAAAAVLPVIAVQALVLGLITTLPALSRHMRDNPSRPYVVGAIASLSATSEPVNNGLVPGDVLWPLIAPRNQLRFFFSPMFGEERFPDARDTLDVLNPFGAIRPGVVIDQGFEESSKPCPWILRDRDTRVRLPEPIIDYWHTLRLTYIASAPSAVEVNLDGGTPATIPIRTGLNDAYAFLDGGGDTVTLRRVPDAVGVCITAVAVGFTVEKMP